MARQQRFDWFLSQHRQRAAKSAKLARKLKQRRPKIETLEERQLLSINMAQPTDDANLLSMASNTALERENAAPIASSAQAQKDALWYIPEGAELPDSFYYHDHNGDGIPDHPAGDHEPGCCCDQCLAASGVGESPFEEFTAFLAWDDQDPETEGIQVTYSYSNLFDGGIVGGINEEDMRAATEEALGLWASVTPLHFIELVDSGPQPDPNGQDPGYEAEDHPNIRIGHHFIDGDVGPNTLAIAYFPPPQGGDGLAGDVRFDNGNVWNIGLFLETMVHELGHSLGLGHETVNDAIMNPSIQNRFGGLGDGFLLPDDIAGIQNLYGVGEGSVEPLTPFEVNTLDDVDDVEIDLDSGGLIDTTPDFLSLREAIVLANNAIGSRQITFAEDLFVDPTQSYSINLDDNLGALDIANDMIIIGPGSAVLTIVAPDGSPADGDGIRIFNVDNTDPDPEVPDTVAEVTISGLALTGGDLATAGGVIFNSEELSLVDIHAHSNRSGESGGAVYSTGLVSIAGSTFENNEAADDGGAIHSLGGVNVDTSALINNQSGDEGGAIAVEGDGNELIVISSTLSGNTATGNGGAIHNIDDNPTKFRVLHSTVYNNTSGGSGGGVYFQDGVLALEHSIVAGNSDTAGAPNIDNINLFASPVVLARYSLVQNANGSNITQQGPNLFGVDPLLEPLADNGGPTMTHDPMDESPVLNAGDPSIPVPPDTDQRGLGFQRILEGIIDIGAVESGGFEQTFTVNTLLDKNDVNALGVDQSPEDLSLREAIDISNRELGRNRINFDASLNGGTINLSVSQGELVISDQTTIDASGLRLGLTINAGTADPTPLADNGDGIRSLRIDDGDALNYLDVALIGLTFTGGDVTGHGGAIHSAENLTLQYVSVLDNYASGNGGGIYHFPAEPIADSVGSQLIIESSTIARNHAGQDGGGLYTNNQQLSTDPEPDPVPLVSLVVQSTISHNVAGDEGGGIYNFDGDLELRHVTVTENQATHGSGVVSYGDGRTRTGIYSSIIAGNAINENNPQTTADDTGFDVQFSVDAPANSFVSLGHNLIGVGNALLAFNNNDIIEVLDPQLGPLRNNGGMTQTHMPLFNSPAIDAGDPNAVLPIVDATDTDVVVPAFDQRGEPFDRIVDGDMNGEVRMDIGAVEAPLPEPDADFDGDNDVDGRDFLAWQRGFGTVDAGRSDGDSDRDGDVDGDDLINWQDQYGDIGPAEVATLTTQVDAAPVPAEVRTGRASFRPDVAASYDVDVNGLLAAAQSYSMRDQLESSDRAVGDLDSVDGYSMWRVAEVDVEAPSQEFARVARGIENAAELQAEQSEAADELETLDHVFESLGLRGSLGFGSA